MSRSFVFLLFVFFIRIFKLFRGEIDEIRALIPNVLLLLRFFLHHQVQPIRLLRSIFCSLLHLYEDLHHAVDYFLFSAYLGLLEQGFCAIFEPEVTKGERIIALDNGVQLSLVL